MSEESRVDGREYDAFISYSHAADDLLAPRLQAGLQRFAKPWWRRRAMRVFRDESSLSASPHLWGSITEALDESSWFVLLLSPDAAGSHWVGEEIEYWIADDSRVARVLPVVTDGEFSWVDGDVIGSAVPPALQGVFSSEPRWVDLRFARGEKQLDLKNPRFSEAVADLASAIRGVPKDELESEEVRQHRRTIRTAWAAASLVLLLGVAASIAAVFAFNEQQRANQQAALAIENAALEAEARGEAETQRADAETQRAKAEQLAEAEAASRATADRQAKIARSQALVLEAEKALESDPELSLHLTLAAIDGFQETDQDTTQAVSVLRAAISADRVLLIEEWGGPLAVDPTGSLLALRSGFDVVVREIASGSATLRCNDANPTGAVFSADGSVLFVARFGSGIHTCDRSRGLRVVVIDIEIFGHPDLVLSRDGRFAAWVGEENQEVTVASIEDQRVVELSQPKGDGPSFSLVGRLAYVEFDQIHQADPVTGAHIGTTLLPGCCYWDTSWSPDGSQIAASGDGGLVAIDAASGKVRWRLPGRVAGPPIWLESLDLLVVGSQSGFLVVNSESGTVTATVGALGQGFGFGLDFLRFVHLPNTTRIAVGGEPGEGELVVFDASPIGGTELAGWTSSLTDIGDARFTTDGSRVILTDGHSSFLIADTYSRDDVRSLGSDRIRDEREELIVTRGGFVAHPGPLATWVVRDVKTSEVVYQTPQGWAIQGVSEDGSVAVIYDEALCGFVVVSTADGAQISRLEEDCGGAHTPGRRFSFSPLGTYVVGSWEGATSDVLFEVGTGTFITNLGVGATLAVFSEDESELLVVSLSGTLYVMEVEKLLAGFTGPEAARLEIPAHETDPTSLSVSPDGSMAATSSVGEPLRLWDLSDGRLVGEFGGDPGVSGRHVAAFHPSEPHLLVATSPNVVRIYTLDLDELIAIAESRLSRNLTEAECQQYAGACAS